MKKDRPKAPWFIWLSFFGLAWLNRKYGRQSFDRELGYTAQLAGMFIGVFAIPTVLMEYLIMDRMPEPWYTVWNAIILAYAYFAGVFITWRLYCYLDRE